MKGKCCIIIILILISGFLITYPIEEEENNLKHYRYKDLGIVSPNKPLNTHLFIEASDGDLYMVDSVDNTLIIKSVDKGANWSTIIDEDHPILALWYDRTTEYIYYLYTLDAGAGVLYDTFIRYIDLSDDSENAVDDWRLAAKNGGSMDVVLDSSGDIYGFSFYTTDIDVPGTWDVGILEWDVDAAVGYYIEPEQGLGADPWASIDISKITVINDFAYFLYQTSDNHVEIWKSQLGAAGWTKLEDLGANLNLPDLINQKGISYDGSDIISFVIKDTGDSKNYLWTYSIGGDTPTKGAEFNVALMLDRNTAAGVLEKAFGIADEIVYEIKPKRGGLIQLQDVSALLSNNIIAISDNLLMDNGGVMLGRNDVTNEISTISYNDGIMGVQKKGTFITHPDFHINWSKGDSIKIYDQYDQLEFWGLITDKNRNNRGLYVFKIDSFTNEIYRNNYSTTYSANDTDTKQKDIIDNACDFCYRSSSIVGTTTTYNYVYNRALIYIFWLGRRLERQVPYIEPDGKIWTKAHDGLTKNDMIYPPAIFKDDADGDEPSGWVSNNDADCTTTIIASQSSHRKVLKCVDESAVGKVEISQTFTDGAQTSGTIEFWWETTDRTKALYFQINDGATRGVYIAIRTSNFQYYDGAFHNSGAVPTNNVISHHRVEFDCATDTFDWYINGVLEVNGGAFENVRTDLDNILIRTVDGNTGYTGYMYDIGYSWDPAYTVGDNEVAWDLNNHWQDVRLMDIPGIEEGIQGFFDGNTGITRNTIRYRDNAQTIRPVAAIRDPIEQLKGILPLNEFRDPKIEASTEADQLGDNRYAIWSADTIFLGLRVAGQGYLQPGKTIHLENTGQITIAESNLLLLSFTRNPKNDVYTQMILSDNIIFPKEFNNLANTSRTQIHTATVQSFENQADIIAHLTPEGGLACRLTNKTGVVSVKGTIVEAHAATDNAFRVCDGNSVESFAIVYEDGIADGSECLIVVGGRCEVLLKDATASTRGNWVKVSDVAGRADATGASPAAAPTHFKEIGHAIESKGADTDVLAFIILHFL